TRCGHAPAIDGARHRRLDRRAAAVEAVLAHGMGGAAAAIHGLRAGHAADGRLLRHLLGPADVAIPVVAARHAGVDRGSGLRPGGCAVRYMHGALLPAVGAQVWLVRVYRL